MIAHFQTLVKDDSAQEIKPELKFYDITKQFDTAQNLSTAEEMMKLTHIFDSCSFTVKKTGCCMLVLVSEATQKGHIVQMDARF